MSKPETFPASPEQKKHLRPVWLQVILIVAGSLAGMALTWLLYVLIYNLLETLFYPNNPLAFPAGTVRQGYALVLTLLYFILLRTRLSDSFKAVLLCGPLSTLMIAAGFLFYQYPVLSIGVMLCAAAACGFYLYKSKKPWCYDAAAITASVIAIAYAWPSASE
jgi:hypothetical protein